MNLFEEILETRSLTVIHWKCEKHLLELDVDAVPDEDQMTIKRIMAPNSLDEVWMFCHEHLGNEEEAATLRKWILDRPKRQSMKPKNPLGGPDDSFPELES